MPKKKKKQKAKHVHDATGLDKREQSVNEGTKREEKKESDPAIRGSHLLMTNQFDAAEELFGKHPNDCRISMLCSILEVLKAVSTYNLDSLSKALADVWATELKGKALCSSKDHAERIRGNLVRGDTHLLGAGIQLIQQSFIKAAWNIRNSWYYYSAAHKELEKYDGQALQELKGWCNFGVGLFNLFLSLLPPTVMKVVSFLGFSLDRQVGVRCLTECCQAEQPCFMAPFACLILLIFYVAILNFVGSQTDADLKTAAELQQWAHVRYPDGVFFCWTRSRLQRCLKEPREAMATADVGLQHCDQVPILEDLFHYQKGFCALFVLDWPVASHSFEAMVSPVQDTKQAEDTGVDESVEAFYLYLVALTAAAQDDSKKAIRALNRVSKLAHSSRDPRPIAKYSGRMADFLVAHANTSNANRKGSSSSRNNSHKLTQHSKQATLFRHVATIALMELIFFWNGFDQMQTECLEQLLKTLEEIQGARLATTAPITQARYWMLRGGINKSLGRSDAAAEHLQEAIKLSSTMNDSETKASGIHAFSLQCYAALLVDTAPDTARAMNAKAKTCSGYDLYKMLQIRIHSLTSRLG